MATQVSQPQDAAKEGKPPPFSTMLAAMYKRWVLNCVVYLGHAVSKDFSNTPELYRSVDLDTAVQLTDMQSQYGFDPDFPSDMIRMMLMKPIFGESDGHGNGNDGSDFQNSRMPVLSAAAGFALNAQPISFQMHRERFRNEAFSFRAFLEELEGASLDQTERRTRNIFDTASNILRNTVVASRFGVNEPIDAEWPLDSNDSTGAKLIEKITEKLPDMPYGIISLDDFVHMQRMAQKGCDSISGVLVTNLETIDVTNDVIDELIREFYAWGSELRLVGGALPQPLVNGKPRGQEVEKTGAPML